MLTLKKTCEKSPAETERGRRHEAGADAPAGKGYAMENMRFTVGCMPTNDHRKKSNPSVWLGGKWLAEYGFNVGDRLELVKGKNMLILVKVPENAQADAPPVRTGSVRLAY